MLYVVPFIASALMFLFIFCAVRAIRDYSGSWVVFSLLAGLMLGVDFWILCFIIFMQ